jgi:hypothetical protein
MVELVYGLVEFAKIIRDDPRFGLSLFVLLIAGAAVAKMIGRRRPEGPLSIRDPRK